MCFHFTNDSAMNISQWIFLHPGAYISEGLVPRSGIIWSICTCTWNSAPTPRFLSTNAANHTYTISWWDCLVSSFFASIGIFSSFQCLPVSWQRNGFSLLFRLASPWLLWSWSSSYSDIVSIIKVIPTAPSPVARTDMLMFIFQWGYI